MDPDPADPRLGPNKKKCIGCCKWLTPEQMGQRLEKGVLKTYSKCPPCREKHAKNSHANRDTEVAKKRKEREEAFAALGPTKKCGYCCKHLPIDQFELKPGGSESASEERFSKCVTCRPKNKESINADRAIKRQKMEFQCSFPDCGKRFSRKDNLDVHQLVHTGEKRHECSFPDCGKRFAQKGLLDLHERVHTGDQPFECRFDGCERSFKSSSKRVRHERIEHTDERPYVCPDPNCGKRFGRKDQFDVHQLVHTGDQPFECRFDGCERRFKHQVQRIRHERREHTGERPYSCPDPNCGAAFARSDTLKSHFDNNHSKEAAKRRKLQEKGMRDALVLGGYTENFAKGLVPAPGEFIREAYFDHRCALARNFMPGEKKYAYVDFVVHTKRGRLVFLEVDEGQHPSPGYSQLCETTRMWNICESIKLADLEMNVFWLRVNSDSAFKINGSNHARERKQRFQEVLTFLDAIESRETDPPMQIGYAFYDCSADHRPLVMNDPEYVDHVKPAVVCIQDGCRLVQPRSFPPVDPMFQSIDVNFAQSDSDSD